MTLCVDTRETDTIPGRAKPNQARLKQSQRSGTDPGAADDSPSESLKNPLSSLEIQTGHETRRSL